MITKKAATVVTIASAATVVTHETCPKYDCAKAAVLNFLRATSRVLKIARRAILRRRLLLTIGLEREYPNQLRFPRHSCYKYHPSRNSC